jgi:hypothetical protein
MSDELQAMKTVNINEGERIVTILDSDGSIRPIGKAVNREYLDDADTTAHVFYAPTMDGKEKRVRLGATTDSWSFVNPGDLAEQLFEAGYTLANSWNKLGKSSLEVGMEFTPPDAITFPDLIAWDNKYWRDLTNDPQRQTGLQERLYIRMGLGTNRGIEARMGFFRLICTNGLVAEYLMLGGYKSNHATFDPARFENFIKSPRTYSVEYKDGQPVLMSTVVSHAAAILPIYHLLEEFLRQRKEWCEDKNNRQDFRPTGIQQTLIQPLNPLRNMNDWYMDNLIEQLGIASTEFDRDNITALDVLNFVTSPISIKLHESPDIAAWRAQDQAGRIAKSLGGLLSTFDDFMGMSRWFTKPEAKREEPVTVPLLA